MKDSAQKDYIRVTRSTLPDYDEYCKEIKKFWDNRWLTNMGEEHQLFQKQLEEYLQCPYVQLHANGHLALENAIRAMDFPIESEVITTPFTFASTTHAIIRNGLVPVFCDIRLEDYTLDPELLESFITDKTVAILPVHVYGNICQVERIQEIADQYGLKVIYDAAHTFGETYQGIPVVNFGDVSILSFHATKVFHTLEGGAVCTFDEKIAGYTYCLKNFGIIGLENVILPGGNAKMNEFQAAMGICNLRHVEQDIAKRKIRYEYYQKQLRNANGIRIPEVQKKVESNYSYFPILLEGRGSTVRDEVYDILQQHGIEARKYFYPLTSQYACYTDQTFVVDSKTPIAESVAQKILTLPLFPDLSMEDIERICQIILHRIK